VVFEARLAHLAVNDAVAVDGLPVPDVTNARDLGFREHTVAAAVPGWLPAGMRSWRTGSTRDADVQAWTDGRAWLKVRSTTAWTGGRLFGDVGDAVHRLDLANGVAYSSEDGNTIAIHATGVDLVVTGSVGPTELRRAAASLPVDGLPVPDSWDEAATASVGQLRAVLDVLVLPDDAGFAPPATRLDDGTATLVFAGPGDRGFVLTTRAGDALTPPLDADATGVVVRGLAGRWSPGRGELEWVAGGQLWSLRTSTIALAELVELANRLDHLR
jgi:hypothetical protein